MPRGSDGASSPAFGESQTSLWGSCSSTKSDRCHLRWPASEPCLKVAHSGRHDRLGQCPLLGVKHRLKPGECPLLTQSGHCHIKPPRRSPGQLCCQLRWASRNIETLVGFQRWPGFVFEIQAHAPTSRPRCFSSCKPRRPDEIFHQTRMLYGSDLD